MRTAQPLALVLGCLCFMVASAGKKNLTVYRITPRNYTGTVSILLVYFVSEGEAYRKINQSNPETTQSPLQIQSILLNVITSYLHACPQSNLDTGDAGPYAC